jgi:hypothetical protein
LTVGETVCERHILAIDIAGVFEALVDCAQKVLGRAKRSWIEESDHRHRWLLRARHLRPRCRAAEQTDKLAPFQLIELHPLPLARVTA